MTRSQWLIVGGLAIGVMFVFVCLCISLMTLVPSPKTSSAVSVQSPNPQFQSIALTPSPHPLQATPVGPPKPQPVEPTSPSASTLTKPTTVSLPPAGTRAVGTNWAITVQKVDRTTTLSANLGSMSPALATLSPNLGTSDFVKPVRSQGLFLILTVKLENVSKKSIPLNSWDFTMNDDQGREYDQSSEGVTFASMYDQSDPKFLFITQQVQPSLSTRVRVIFDVAPDATGLILLVQNLPSIQIGNAK